MNRNELVEKIAAMVLESPDLLTALEEMAKGTTDAEPAAEQRPDMMYVLTQKVKVHTEDGSELYHYHPIVGETLLFAGCTRNRMISSPNLLELQNMAREMTACKPCSTKRSPPLSTTRTVRSRRCWKTAYICAGTPCRLRASMNGSSAR